MLSILALLGVTHHKTMNIGKSYVMGLGVKKSLMNAKHGKKKERLN
jgi:hypothetical protein